MENTGKKNIPTPGDENRPWRLRLDYNSPVILTFTLICGLIFILDRFSNGWFSLNLFSLSPGFTFSDFAHYPTLATHVFGHVTAQHLALNLSIILLIGPILEEKYGAGPLLAMIAVTALATGLLHVLFFSYGLLGASGIAFMLILLSSFANAKAGTIPLTFILILILYLGNEFSRSGSEDNISHFAHILGGICGSLFGFLKSGNLQPQHPQE